MAVTRRLTALGRRARLREYVSSSWPRSALTGSGLLKQASPRVLRAENAATAQLVRPEDRKVPAPTAEALISVNSTE